MPTRDHATPVPHVFRQPRNPAGRKGKESIRNANRLSTDDATYTCRRLLRDRPDLFERVESGELSPNAAAIEVVANLAIGGKILLCKLVYR